jgi:hypothetical protein
LAGLEQRQQRTRIHRAGDRHVVAEPERVVSIDVRQAEHAVGAVGHAAAETGTSPRLSDGRPAFDVLPVADGPLVTLHFGGRSLL